MKNCKACLVLLSLVALIFSCSSPKEKAANNINDLNNEIFSDTITTLDRQKAAELIDAYIDYAENYPEDEITPEYLFKAGELAMNTNKGDRAVNIFEQVINNYPDFDKVPESMFLMGFVYENIIENLDKAKEVYEEFIDLFPDHDFADDAQLSIKNLGISPEDLIKMFEKKAREDSLTAKK